MRSERQYRIGIDLGGTKIEGVLMQADGSIAKRERVPTPADDYDAILDAIRDLVERLSNDPTLPVGIGTPGSISRVSPLMRNSNSTCLNGRPLADDLSRHLAREVRMANDADCFALSEAIDGAGADCSSVFGVILGTGVGGGLAIDNQLVTGINGIAGEWGHNPLPPIDEQFARGRDCFCGRQDCVETYLSGPGLTRSYQERTRRSLSALDIVQAIDTDADARHVIERYCEQLAASLAVVINIFDPEIIVLGGGLSNIELLYEAVPDRLPHYVFSDHVATRLARAQHGDSSGVRGAAWLY